MRTPMNFFFVATLFVMTTLLPSTHACGFQDPVPTTEEIYNARDLVFAGNVTRVDAPAGQFQDKNVTIDITRIWKQADSDNFLVNDTITIYTAANDALCGIMPAVGESWIIFSGSSRSASNTESTLYTEILSTELDNVSDPAENTQACGDLKASCTRDDDCCGTNYCHSNNKCKAVPGNGSNRYLRSSSH